MESACELEICNLAAMKWAQALLWKASTGWLLFGSANIHYRIYHQHIPSVFPAAMLFSSTSALLPKNQSHQRLQGQQHQHHNFSEIVTPFKAERFAAQHSLNLISPPYEKLKYLSNSIQQHHLPSDSAQKLGNYVSPRVANRPISNFRHYQIITLPASEYVIIIINRKERRGGTPHREGGGLFLII